jgi:hypothetical protein
MFDKKIILKLKIKNLYKLLLKIIILIIIIKEELNFKL